MKPNIFLIDLDGTIIGDISPQVVMWELSKKCAKAVPIKHNNVALQEKLKNGIVRPHFIDFMKYLQSIDALVYVYTASEKSWANFVISQIEHAYNVKFERPIFTRMNCSLEYKEYKKSLHFITKQLEKAIRKRHASHFQVFGDVKSHVTIIDNTNVYHHHDQSSLVVCPTYTFQYPENLGCVASYVQFKEYEQQINDCLSRYIQGYTATSDYWTFQKRMAVLYVNSITRMKQTMSQDNFFENLLKFVKVHPKHLYAKYINRHISSF